MEHNEAASPNEMFKKFVQIGVVVADLDQTIQQLNEIPAFHLLWGQFGSRQSGNCRKHINVSGDAIHVATLRPVTVPADKERNSYAPFVG